jgi:hypothetical protein
MGAVDYFNREALTVYKATLRTVKVWKHIFNTLLHIAIYISFALYQIAFYTVKDKRGKPCYQNLGPSPNKAFRLRLADELCKRQREHTYTLRKFKRRLKPLATGRATVEQILEHTTKKITNIPKFKNRRAECAYCRIRLRQGIGKAPKHCKLSSYGCAVCEVGLCLGDCFKNYHEALWLPDDADMESCEPEENDMD